MEEFGWVTARAECTIPKAFAALLNGVRDDVARRQSLKPEPLFEVGESGESFTVSRADPVNGKAQLVTFTRRGTAIEITGDDRHLNFTATLTLNDEGECRFLVNGEERKEWQVRRRALERLFFA